MKNGCVIGCGAISPMHAEGLLRTEYGQLAGVCDVLPERAQDMGKRYGVTVYPNFEEVLKDETIDVVHICSPHFLHAPMTKQALLAGKAVVLEKPVAISGRELDDLLAFVGKHGYENRLSVMFQTRNNFCIREIRRLMKEDASLGKLRGISAHLTWKRDESYYASGDWRGTWEQEGGGVLINQAIHTIDLMLLLAGSVKRMIAGAYNRMIKTIEVEDTADVSIEFESGIKGVFTATNGYSTTVPANIELDFEHAVLRYADQALYRIDEENIRVLCRDDHADSGKQCWGNGHAKAIDDFYCFLQNEGGTHLPLSEAVPAMRFVFEVYRQAFGRES